MTGATRFCGSFLAVTVLVALGSVCGDGDDGATVGGGSPGVRGTVIPSALGESSTGVEPLAEAVLGAAAGYTQKQTTAEEEAAAREAFAVQFTADLGAEIAGFELLRFLKPEVSAEHTQAPDGTLIIELGTVAARYAPGLREMLGEMQESGVDDFGSELRDRYNAVDMEEIEDADGLGDICWGLKMTIDGGDMVSFGSSPVEFPDLPYTMLVFARYNALVRVSAYYDDGLDPLAVARAVDRALMGVEAE